MTQKQIQIIKKSWRIFMKIDPVAVGGLFYDKLFHEFPELEKMFTNSREEQAKKLIEMVNVVVMRLDRLTELTEDIRQMAIRHVAYGVVPVHYEQVGAALLWTLERGLGSDWTPELAGAWTQCYTLLADTMISAIGHQSKQES
jgi:hemoglobin-like flavoprotein